MKRNILFITSDQQRYDSLGCTGNPHCRTPVIDRLADEGVLYDRAHVHNVVCMPSRSTMLTGQLPRTHGVIANGVPLPEDAPSVARWLRTRAGYRTALLGKAHFEPHLDPLFHFFENRCASEGSTGPWRGFEHVELATHGPMGGHHYARWLWEEHPEDVSGFAAVLTGAGGGDTGAPEVAHNPIPRERYHTDWVADRTIDWLSRLDEEDPFFCWMSFPDPHHPFDPPVQEVRDRIDWRELPLPPRYLAGAEAERVLGDKPAHWLAWYRGEFRNPEGGPITFTPSRLTGDMLREVNALIHVENELIDDAIGRVLGYLERAGIADNTDVIFTSDHGDLQGDYGLLFKGPYHVDSLLRIPLVWRPAKTANVSPARLRSYVGHVDLAPTFCEIADVKIPAWMQGAPLPTSEDASRERHLVTFDSQFSKVGMHLRTILRDDLLCTVYEPRTHDQGGRFRFYWSIWGLGTKVPDYRGTEGELYDLKADPDQRVNLWSDPAWRARRDELVADLYEHLPPAREPALRVVQPT